MVLQNPLSEITETVRAKQSKRLPTVFTKKEVQAILAHTDGVQPLVLSLLYGTGMRLMEGLRLRVKDIDFDRKEITVREAKGDQDRITMLLTLWTVSTIVVNTPSPATDSSPQSHADANKGISALSGWPYPV
jgi:integrase